MIFFCDYHHGGGARGLFLTLKYRLGHDLYFPNHILSKYACDLYGKVGTWLHCCPIAFPKNGGIPSHLLNPDGTFPFTINTEQFLNMDWDAVFITRTESVPIFRKLLDLHPKGNKIKRIFAMGSENSQCEWDWVPNFMASDYLSYIVAPEHINKIHYSQEMGTQYAEDYKEFVPITRENLKTISTFINCLPHFNGPWKWDSEQSGYRGKCPHCDGYPDMKSRPEISPYGIWCDLKKTYVDHSFRDYGIINSCGSVSEKDLPQKYLESALTWHFKTYDGWGYSLLQSIAMGRLAIVPRRFHRYRTANKYLINNLTCFEAEWTPESIGKVIEYFTSDLDRANKYSEACFHAAKHLFNWELESFRVQEFLNHLK